MTDLFADKAADWDTRPIPAQISEGVARALDATVPLKPTDTVMDFGAGTGLLCGHVAPRVQRVVAVDVSQAMLDQLAAKPDLTDRVDTVCQDITQEPLDATFDVVVSAMAMHHVEDTDHLLATLRDHLAPGGHVAIADLDTEPGTFHPPGMDGVFHHGFDRDALTAKAEAAGFTDVTFTTACTVDREDERRYPVFLMTARRAD